MGLIQHRQLEESKRQAAEHFKKEIDDTVKAYDNKTEKEIRDKVFKILKARSSFVHRILNIEYVNGVDDALQTEYGRSAFARDVEQFNMEYKKKHVSLHSKWLPLWQESLKNTNDSIEGCISAAADALKGENETFNVREVMNDTTR